MTEHDHDRPTVPADGPADPSDEGDSRHHFELAPLPWLAGCSDVGRRHGTNQDAIALSGRELPTDRVAVLNVSDGVSTSLGSERSSAIAVDVITSALVGLLRADPQVAVEPFETMLADAYVAANDAVLTANVPDNPAGSCTLVTTVAWDGHICVANLGDARAYWIPDEGEALLLSTDDSLAQARIAMGVSREEAENGPQAHAITRWIGPDATDVVPRISTLDRAGAGWLMACSDGLWNYCSPVEQMRALVHEAAAQCGNDASAMCRLLVDWANDQGGRDNITVGLARLEDAQA